MQTIQIVATAVTASGQTYVDLPQGGRIRGVVFTAFSTSYNASDYIQLELSTVSTNQTTVSDARSVAAIATFTVVGGGATGSSNLGNQSFYCPSDVSVKSGDRLYLNYTESGSGSWGLRALVFY